MSPGIGDTGQFLISCWLYYLMQKEGKVFTAAVTEVHSRFPFYSNSNFAHFYFAVVELHCLVLLLLTSYI